MYGLTSRQIHRRLAARYHPIGFRACREIPNADDANGTRTSAYNSFYNTAEPKTTWHCIAAKLLYRARTAEPHKSCFVRHGHG